jgi:hypothetical protein
VSAAASPAIVFKDRPNLPVGGPSSRLRRPLGLAPVAEADDDLAPSDPGPLGGDVFARALSDLPLRERHAPANIEALAEIADDCLKIASDRIRPVREEVSSLRSENERLRSQLAELKSKLSEIDFIVERLKVENRGPPGAQGLRGRDGRDGPQGVRGERGPKGDAGAELVGWSVSTGDYTAEPLLSNGKVGPRLFLRALFEQAYADAALTDDVSEAEEALDARMRQRAELDRQMANVRAGRPPSAR